MRYVMAIRTFGLALIPCLLLNACVSQTVTSTAIPAIETQAKAVLQDNTSRWFEIRLELLGALIEHELGDLAGSQDRFDKALLVADEVGMKRQAYEALVWRMHRCAQRGEEGADVLARNLLDRTSAAWTSTSRGLAGALIALATQSVEEARRSECLASLPGPVHLRQNTLKTLTVMGSLFDSELERRCLRLASSLES